MSLVHAVTSGHVGDTLDVSEVATVVEPDGVQSIQTVASNLLVDEKVNAYAVAIARKTREWPGVAIGAGPRGGIALIRAARARALPHMLGELAACDDSSRARTGITLGS